MLFSQRKGLKSVRTRLQVDDMDRHLRIGLWNAVKTTLYEHDPGDTLGDSLEFEFYLDQFHKTLCLDYFKIPIDEFPREAVSVVKMIKDYFFKCEWYEVYDFLEFVADNFFSPEAVQEFIEYSNDVMEREQSAYRFVGNKITQITSEIEIEEIELALAETDNLKPVNAHLKRSLELLADRKAPDYRNSIKESISAIECLSATITGKQKAELGDALNELQKEWKLHPALKKGFSSLYGYTSDADGIRHALMNEEHLRYEDAKYFLVSCSAFVNYLLAKLM